MSPVLEAYKVAYETGCVSTPKLAGCVVVHGGLRRICKLTTMNYLNMTPIPHVTGGPEINSIEKISRRVGDARFVPPKLSGLMNPMHRRSCLS